MRGAIGGILTIKRADREDNASSASNDDGETWHTQSAEKWKFYLNLIVELILRIFLSGSSNKRSSLLGLQRVPENPRTRPETVVTRPDPSKDFDLG